MMSNIDKDIEVLTGFVGRLNQDVYFNETTSFEYLKKPIENVLKELEIRQKHLNFYEKNESYKAKIMELIEEIETNKKAVDNLLVKNAELKQELETQINNTHILQSQLDVANAEKIEWKKIAEKLAILIHRTNAETGCYVGRYGLVENCKGMSWCKQCIIEWAKSEVKKDEKE